MTIRIGLSAAVFAAALVLTGCGGSDSSAGAPAPGASTPAGQSAAPGANPSAPTDNQGAPASGNFDGAGSRPLPAGFPQAEIPIAAGTIVDATTGDVDGPYAYTVLVQVPAGSPAEVMAGVTRQLRDTGFTAAPGPATKATSIATFTNHTYDVGVNVVRADGKTVVTYVVVRKVR